MANTKRSFNPENRFMAIKRQVRLTPYMEKVGVRGGAGRQRKPFMDKELI